MAGGVKTLLSKELFKHTSPNSEVLENTLVFLKVVSNKSGNRLPHQPPKVEVKYNEGAEIKDAKICEHPQKSKELLEELERFIYAYAKGKGHLNKINNSIEKHSELATFIEIENGKIKILMTDDNGKGVNVEELCKMLTLLFEGHKENGSLHKLYEKFKTLNEFFKVTFSKDKPPCVLLNHQGLIITQQSLTANPAQSINPPVITKPTATEKIQASKINNQTPTIETTASDESTAIKQTTIFVDKTTFEKILMELSKIFTDYISSPNEKHDEYMQDYMKTFHSDLRRNEQGGIKANTDFNEKSLKTISDMINTIVKGHGSTGQLCKLFKNNTILKKYFDFKFISQIEKINIKFKVSAIANAFAGIGDLKCKPKEGIIVIGETKRETPISIQQKSIDQPPLSADTPEMLERKLKIIALTLESIQRSYSTLRNYYRSFTLREKVTSDYQAVPSFLEKSTETEKAKIFDKFYDDISSSEEFNTEYMPSLKSKESESNNNIFKSLFRDIFVKDSGINHEYYSAFTPDLKNLNLTEQVNIMLRIAGLTERHYKNLIWCATQEIKSQEGQRYVINDNLNNQIVDKILQEDIENKNISLYAKENMEQNKQILNEYKNKLINNIKLQEAIDIILPKLEYCSKKRTQYKGSWMVRGLRSLYKFFKPNHFQDQLNQLNEDSKNFIKDLRELQAIGKEPLNAPINITLLSNLMMKHKPKEEGLISKIFYREGESQLFEEIFSNIFTKKPPLTQGEINKRKEEAEPFFEELRQDGYPYIRSV